MTGREKLNEPSGRTASEAKPPFPWNFNSSIEMCLLSISASAPSWMVSVFSKAIEFDEPASKEVLAPTSTRPLNKISLVSIPLFWSMPIWTNEWYSSPIWVTETSLSITTVGASIINELSKTHKGWWTEFLFCSDKAIWTLSEALSAAWAPAPIQPIEPFTIIFLAFKEAVEPSPNAIERWSFWSSRCAACGLFRTILSPAEIWTDLLNPATTAEPKPPLATASGERTKLPFSAVSVRSLSLEWTELPVMLPSAHTFQVISVSLEKKL